MDEREKRAKGRIAAYKWAQEAKAESEATGISVAEILKRQMAERPESFRFKNPQSVPKVTETPAWVEILLLVLGIIVLCAIAYPMMGNPGLIP